MKSQKSLKSKKLCLLLMIFFLNKSFAQVVDSSFYVNQIQSPPIKELNKKSQIPDSILFLIEKHNWILMNDRKKERDYVRNRIHPVYRKVLMISLYDNFFAVWIKHHEVGTHHHLIFFDYKGNVRLSLEFNFAGSRKKTIELMQKLLVEKKYETSNCPVGGLPPCPQGRRSKKINRENSPHCYDFYD